MPRGTVGRPRTFRNNFDQFLSVLCVCSYVHQYSTSTLKREVKIESRITGVLLNVSKPKSTIVRIYGIGE